MASSYAKEDPEDMSSEHQALEALWHRRAEDGKVEYLPPQPLVEALEDQVGQILELVKMWREKNEKSGQASRDPRDSQAKKRAAPPSEEPRRSSRPKKPRRL